MGGQSEPIPGELQWPNAQAFEGHDQRGPVHCHGTRRFLSKAPTVVPQTYQRYLQGCSVSVTHRCYLSRTAYGLRNSMGGPNPGTWLL